MSGTRARTRRSGLVARVRASRSTRRRPSARRSQFLADHVRPRTDSPMCGNSVCQDRRFLARWMPELERYFHYRNLDVSTVKELARRWAPEVAAGVAKESRHTALADVHESIAELRHYRAQLFAVHGTLRERLSGRAPFWHAGGCHCGRVRIEVARAADLDLLECNCSMCARSGLPAPDRRRRTVPAAVRRRRSRRVPLRHGHRQASLLPPLRRQVVLRPALAPRRLQRQRPLPRSRNDHFDAVRPFDGRNWEAARSDSTRASGAWAGSSSE